MSLKLKILLLVLLIILGVFPSFGDVLNDKEQYRYLYNRLTTYGWAMIGLIVGVVVLSIIVEMKNDKESAATKQQLNDIKKAIEDGGMKYDSSTNTIQRVSQNNTTTGIHVSGHGNQLSHMNISGGTYGVYFGKPQENPDKPVLRNILFTPKDLEEVFEMINNRSKEINSKEVFYHIVHPVHAKRITDQVSTYLKTKGFSVLGLGAYWSDYYSSDSRSIGIDLQDQSKIGVFIGVSENVLA